jgi:glycosyltransferase involved in cell wall biosynthesis
VIGRDIVLLSTADWDNPFWTNKQHVAVQLARRGHRVLYVDSLGLRPPGVNTEDVKRIGRRLRRAAAGTRTVADNLYVWSPILLPFQKSAPIRALNRRALSFALARARRNLRFARPLLWTYNPITTRLLDMDGFAGVVYHCVDDVAAQPGMPAGLVREAEQELAGLADIIFATAPRLAETQSRYNVNTHFLPNVADFDHFSRALDPGTEVPADLARIPGPRLGLIGAISGYKIDFPLLRRVAEQRPDWSIVLIGRVGEGEPDVDSAVLEGLPNLHLLGPRPYDQLPAYLRGIDVALLPSASNDYTASMFPMKFFEYLAAGRPIVSVDLPAIRPFRHVVTIAGFPAAFIASIDNVLRGESPPLAERLDAARAHTWDARMERMLSLLETTTGPSHRWTAQSHEVIGQSPRNSRSIGRIDPRASERARRRATADAS